jgi:uncharacterized protein YegJ (DUF2314 family)
MNELKEPPSNICLVCKVCARKNMPRYRRMPLKAFVGKSCKLLFLDGDVGEHMWVRCTGVAKMDGFQLKGTLSNDPVAVTGLDYGKPVLFNRSEIEDVFEQEEAQNEQ